MPGSAYLPPLWKDGQNRRWRVVVCCPVCGGTILGIGATHGKRVRYMRCKTCNHTWRDVNDDFSAKAWAVG